MYTFMHGYSPFYSPYEPGLLFAVLPFVLLVALWTIVIKGYALWTAAKSDQKWWFVALLVINTVGILELVYLVWFSPKGSNRLNSSMSPATPVADSSPQA